jgi:putative hemolysin
LDLETPIDEPPSSVLLAEMITDPTLFLVGSGVILIVLLALSALISGSEVAFFSLNANDLDTCRDSKKKSDKQILHLLIEPRALLATILILNNLINVGIVTYSTYMLWELTGSHSPEAGLIALLTVAITFAIVFFGEVIPKVYASQNYLPLARTMAGVLSVASLVVKPVSWLLLSTSNLIEQRIQKKGYNISMDELNQAIEITTTNENTSEEEKEILKGIVNFGTINVKQIMRSRLDITAVDMEMSFGELLERINHSGFSRMPAFMETLDNVKGILYIKDLLPHLDQGDNFEWQKLLRTGIFVPETKKIDSLLKDFQEKRVHMAIVVDEYGGTSGLITLEDIIEEIIGEINDEFDDEINIAYNKLDDNTFIFEGKTSLNDFCKVIDEDPALFGEVKGESESLGGLVLEIHTKIPRPGEKVVFDKFVFTVVDADEKRIRKVRVFIKKEESKNEKS